MKVLLIHADLEGGGPQRVLRRLVLWADRTKFEVGLCYIPLKFKISAALIDEIKFAKTRLFLLRGKHPLLDPRFFFSLVSAVRRFSPDVINFHTASMAIVGAPLRYIYPRAKFVYSDHTPIDNIGSPWLSRWQYPTLKFSLRKMDGIIFVSAEVQNIFKKLFQLTHPKMSIIHPGIEIPTIEEIRQMREKTRKYLGVSDYEILVGGIGMLEKRKGFHDLLMAFSKVASSRRFPLKLVLFGDGPEYPNLKEMANCLGISDKAIFTGYWNGVSLEALAALDIYVHPSYMEAMSAALIEAAACGLPLVASKVGGNTSIVDSGNNGYLFECGDISELSQSLNLLINKSLDERRQMGRLSRTKAQSYSVEKMVKKYEEFWLSIVA
ncbi:MAG: glycosyltransferase family 4 protein [Candidatus Methanomethyliaceae archaeon]